MTRIYLAHGVVLNDAELEWRTARSGGPGGQHVNTTSSKVELRWNIAESAALTPDQRRRLLERLSSQLTTEGILRIQGSRHRSQHRNRQDVLQRLRTRVAAALAIPTPRRRSRPSRGARQRRLHDKRTRADIKRNRRPPRPE
ncbi:alternative ribosome rescue aminoacyl-tRNA hydrolase ArfB [Lipingzhangella sp. LS1_29]|uniref:Alternative ribosome rescue aminoacyl-tRNA hydrolase ArfB n=1 Tax=Lipingzhangella rawalii TaxID=2055835 RepID=A0ABU2H380_9ACTN|nr:alternative ribosome rescue aminoacyl-tRNA hydrolase ArfB [Lipingzhangella rawalii]MDS1269089.1 alternative ribosome rescue aminoacyl-tRNA hydrolase ArfB [Lipingzhangella rawalii]